MVVHETAEVLGKIGKNTNVWHQAQIRENAEVGDNCNLGKCVYIDKNVKIGNNCKIQNYVSVYDGVIVEDGVFLGPSMTFINDMYPRAFTEGFNLTKTLIKKGVSIGANATIMCGVTIGEYAMIAAGSVVTRDVPPYALMLGSPARVVGKVCKCGQREEKCQGGCNYK